jgi:hypothetical protein
MMIHGVNTNASTPRLAPRAGRGALNQFPQGAAGLGAQPTLNLMCAWGPGGLNLTLPTDPSLASQFQASPGYQYNLQQQQNAIQNSAAGKTGALSGNMLQALFADPRDAAALRPTPDAPPLLRSYSLSGEPSNTGGRSGGASMPARWEDPSSHSTLSQGAPAIRAVSRHLTIHNLFVGLRREAPKQAEK